MRLSTHDRFATFTIALLLAALAREGVAQPSPEQGAAPADAEEQELLELTEVLAQETEIATKSRMNSDYVPGTVTVLEGAELEALGARTVGEALTLVPGIMALFQGDGTPLVTVRGVVFPFNSGNVKVLVDGVSVTEHSAGVNTSMLMLPIEMVDRIEFIRGPGSTIHGDFAYLGLLNVITRDEGRRAYVAGDGFGTIEAGVNVAGSHGPHHLGLDVAGLRSDDALAPEGASAEENRLAAVGRWRYKGFTASLHVVRRYREQDGSDAVDENDLVGEVRHESELTPTLASDLRASYLREDFVLPDLVFRGNRLSLGWGLTWKGMKRNTWLFSLDGSQANADDAVHTPPLPPPIRPAPEDASGTSRKTFGLSVQDQIELGDALTLTVGSRFDRIDERDEVTPRLALVWRAAAKHILKVQHAEGFRAATFFELYGTGERNDDLDPEVVKTTELSYIYRAPKWTTRVTGFHSRLSGLIQPAFIPPPGQPTLFANVASAKATGGELEWEQRFSPHFKVVSNASYSNVEDERAFGAGPRWTGGLALIGQSKQHVTASLHLYHVGQRGSGAGAVEGFDLVDTSVTFANAGALGLSFSAGAKNLFGDDVTILAAAPGVRLTSNFETRTWWAQVSYKF